MAFSRPNRKWSQSTGPLCRSNTTSSLVSASLSNSLRINFEYFFSTQRPHPRLWTNLSAHSRGGPVEVAEVPFNSLKLNIRTSSFRSALQDRTCNKEKKKINTLGISWAEILYRPPWEDPGKRNVLGTGSSREYFCATIRCVRWSRT